MPNAALTATRRNQDISKGRNQAIESLRILSAFGIVVFHARAPGYEIFYSGLVVFLALSPMFETSTNWHRIRSVTSLAKTFMIPWLFWFVVFGVLNAVTHKPILSGGWNVLGVLAGTSIHLWFLPFMFAILVVLNGAKPRVSRTALLWMAVVAVSALLVTAPLWQEARDAWPRPVPQWAQALPAVLGGIVVGLAAGGAGTVALGILCAALTVAAFADVPGISVPYAIGAIALGLATLAGRMRLPPSYNVQPLANCMFGVYLIHPLALSAFNRLVGQATFTGAALAFLVSLFVVWMAQRAVPQSRLVIG